MNGRGRIFENYGGRGSYNGRGSGYRGGYRGSGHRGTYEGRGGRGVSYSYSNEDRFNSGGDRYNTGRDRIEDSYKSYRNESTSSYAGRNYVSSVSPDRKRRRMDDSGDRRSHDGDRYGGVYNRQEGYSGDWKYYDDRRRSLSREIYRKSDSVGRSRSPIRGAPRSRASRPPRRSYRGRSLRSRGPYRGNIRSRPYSRRARQRTYNYSGTYKSFKKESLKGRSSMKPDEDTTSTTEEDWDADEKEVERQEKIEAKKSSKAEHKGQEERAKEEADEGDDTDSDKKDTTTPRSAITGRRFIQLNCVHCKENFITFSSFSKHLTMLRHRTVLGSVARRLKAELVRMRISQRDAQQQLEEEQTDDLQPATAFCVVCRLKYRTTRQAHNATDMHRTMKQFLLPQCRVCNIHFRSPMAYEHHICSLEHIKRKAKQAARHPRPMTDDGSGDEGMDVDFDNFMTLDSVGDVDELDDEGSSVKREIAQPKKEIKIGSEYIKKLEVWWCELCRVYLPRALTVKEEEEALRRHCCLRVHLGHYVQHRDTRTLRKQAERIHRQLHQKGVEKGETSLEIKNTERKNLESAVKKENEIENSNSADIDDKLWADVDKDIGDLLRDVESQDNDGSDEEVDLGRYDKKTKDDEDVDEGGTGDVGEKAAKGE